MEEERMDWLDGQTLTIPIEKFIKMRLEHEETKRNFSESNHKRWKLEDELKETKEALEEAKKQIRKLIGIEEGADADVESE